MNYMDNISIISNLLGAAFFLLLAVLLLINWRHQLVGALLILCSLISSVWFSFITYNTLSGDIPLIWIKVVETVRDCSWLVFLYVVLKQRPDISISTRFKIMIPFAISFLTLALITLIIFQNKFGNFQLEILNKVSINYIGYLLVALLGLLLVEQLYRSTLPSARWAVKFLCLGIGGIFAYDFFLYSEALLFNRINSDIWFVRGAVNAMCVPLIAVAVARNPQWKMELFVSRHVVYQSTATFVAGVYLMSMAIIGYYIRNFGGTWGSALQIVFIFGASLFLVVFIFSEQMRVRLKVYLAEHFYKNKYDYRQEWLGITRILSENKDDNELYGNIIRAVAKIMNSPGGGIWLEDHTKLYRKTASLSFHENVDEEIHLSPELIELMTSSHAVINLSRYRKQPEVYKKIELPAKLSSYDDIWLMVSLINGDSLLGFLLILRPHTEISFEAEDIDLLTTVGKQIASYIALLQATENLAEARQFEAFNRLSAFVVHDIKNLVAQLSLINTNSIKFRNEPEFIDDTFLTIENSVSKMKRLLANLRKEEILGTQVNQQISVNELLRRVVTIRSVELPVPIIEKMESDLLLTLNKDELESVLEHLVQNAQEATSDDGNVTLSSSLVDNEIRIYVRDNGSGMDDEFIRKRLFRPFDTTKGNAGMGIGVYESRAIVQAMGGRIRVESKVGKGTVFTICLPLTKIKSED
ncbi:MAG: PEP-CTERM system histidine kinase PrsK [Gammaproteobacteria bacterium]|nr:PEP-CTERM system histidine kinase PrsK [Gammaproteobacteria bacterium]